MESILQSVSRVTDLAVTAARDYGLHYAETLRRWQTNLHCDEDALDALGLDDRFVRMWDFYLCYCEAGFDERAISVVQMALARPAWRPHHDPARMASVPA
jgi:cyclopropane-fatty-acyl-phospholipid synthase